MRYEAHDGRQGWCAEGSDQAFCHRNHSWGKLSPGPSRSKDRECPVCQCNLSLNRADIPKVWLVGYCHGGCEASVVRDALLNLGIPALCLGRFGLPSRQTAATAAFPSRPDAATLAAARRSYACQQLVRSELTNGSLLKMCLQAISEGDGSVPGDPALLLPGDYREFIALAARTGIERCHAAKLARAWTSKSVA